LDPIARPLQGRQSSRQPDFGCREDLRVLQSCGAAALELAGNGPDRIGGTLRQGFQPLFVLVSKGQCAVTAGALVHAPAEYGEHIAKVIILPVIHHPNNGRRVAGSHKSVDQFLPQGRVYPAAPEAVQGSVRVIFSPLCSERIAH
jgi:hypothetical protein